MDVDFMTSSTIDSLKERAGILLVVFTIATLLSATYLYWVHSIPVEEKEEIVLANYTHNFDYNCLVSLRNNSLYDARFIDPNKDTAYLRITESLDFNVSYTFKITVGGTGNINYVVNLILKSPLGWQRELGTIADGNIKFKGVMATLSDNFKIHPNAYWDLINTIEYETGTKSNRYSIIVDIRIHVYVVTGVGTVNENFTPVIVINLERGTNRGDIITVDGENTFRKSEIIKINTIRRDYIVNQRYYSYILTSTLGGGFIFSVYLFIKSRPKDKNIDKILQALGDVIVDIKEEPSDLKERTLIKVETLNDIIKVSDSLLKPVLLLKNGKEAPKLYVIDEDIVYEYTVK